MFCFKWMNISSTEVRLPIITFPSDYLFKVYFESCAIFKRVHSSGKLDMSTWAGFLFIYRTPKWKTFFVCKSGMEGNSSAASATWKTFLVWTLVSKLLLRFTSSHLSHCHGHFKGKLPIRVQLQTKVPEDYTKIRHMLVPSVGWKIKTIWRHYAKLVREHGKQ